jgi:hypothetical protein
MRIHFSSIATLSLFAPTRLLRAIPALTSVALTFFAAVSLPRQSLAQPSAVTVSPSGQSGVQRSGTEFLRTQFQNPPADTRPMMRWWWFGPAVTKPELQKELETMAAAGIGGVEIQPVYPLMLDDDSKGIKNLPYLSPEFLDDISFANRTARSLGLRVDITLGSGWPYGGPHTPLALAAGCLRVIAVPITSPIIIPPALEPGDTFIAAFAVTGSEHSFDPATAQPIDLTTGQISPPTPHTPHPTLQPGAPGPSPLGTGESTTLNPPGAPGPSPLGTWESTTLNPPGAPGPSPLGTWESTTLNPPGAPGPSPLGTWESTTLNPPGAPGPSPLGTWESTTPNPTTPPRTALFFISSHTRQAVKRAAFGAEGLVLDHFSHPAIDAHIADVATPLLNAFGDQPPYSVFSDSLEVYGSDWTPNLPAEFLRRRGYDLIPHLPELLAGGSPQAESVRHDWAQTLSDLIRENYLTPLTHFAQSRHTQFRSQTYGQPAVTLADQAIPNLPEGEGPQWREFSYTRWATSAAHLYHRNVVSAETFTWLHSPAFRATPLDMKVEADRMFLLGVNQIVGHGWPYSPPAAGEPGWSLYAAAVFNNHNPWFAVMPDIARYLQRISWLLRQGAPANDIAILLPEDDAQAAFTPGHDSVTDEMHKRITPELVSTILDSGYNLDFIDATTINKLDKIPYPVLVIPSTTRIPLATYKKIESYAASGGHVIAIGHLPSLAPGLMDQTDSPRIADLTQSLFHATNHTALALESTSDLPAALHKALAPDVVLTSAGAPGPSHSGTWDKSNSSNEPRAVGVRPTPETNGIGFIHRKLPAADIYFVVNSTNQPFTGTVQFRAQHPFIHVWDPDSGRELYRVISNTVDLSLAPYESRVFVLSYLKSVRSNSGAIVFDSVGGTRTVQPEIRDLGTNWQIRFPDSPAPDPISSLVSWTDLPNRQFFSGEAIYTSTFTLNPDDAHSDVVLDFGPGTPTVDTRPPNASGIHALLDPPIREAATIFVNGTPLGSLWHPPYRLRITAALHPGQNTLEVHVYSTAINLLASQPPRDLTALRARFGHRFDPQDMDNLHPIPSGLLGPITLDIRTPK